MRLSDLKLKHVSELVEMANTSELEGANRLRKQELVFALLKHHAKKGEAIFGDGTLEVLQDGFGFLRSPGTMTSTSRPRRSGGSTSTPATRSKARSARPRMASATSPS